MAYITPSAADFKTKFTRDFPFGSSLSTVTDTDISNAMIDANMMFNTELWDSQEAYSNAYLLLTAHCLVLSLRASSQGITGNYDWLVSSKSVGSVSESQAIPQRILDNPLFAMYVKTNYGAKYLMFCLPYLTGAMFSMQGTTHP